jgi:polygalacturonase
VLKVMKRTFFFVGAWALAMNSLHAVNPAMPCIPTNVFNVTQFGALGDGLKDNTTNLQHAIDTASAAGGGVVEFSAGKYLSGPITLLSRINLRLDEGAVLQMLPLGRYPGGETNAQTFINANGATDLELSGRGAIDGQGAPWWEAHLAGRPIVRPMMINLYSCNRLFIHDVTFSSPPNHHCGLRKDGGNITISNLTVNTDPQSPNTDGLNVVGTNVLIRDCHISDGDDNIAMGATGVLRDALITNCVFGRGHGVSLGSGVRDGVSNLVMANCSFNGTDCGLRFKSDNGSGGLVQNLFYHDITMTNVQMPVLIYSYYRVAKSAGKLIKFTPKRAADLPVEPVTSTTPVWRDLTFSNITAYATVAGGVIWGKPNLPVSNVNFVRVNITSPGPFLIYNAKGIRFQDCRIELKDAKFTMYNADVVAANTKLVPAPELPKPAGR